VPVIFSFFWSFTLYKAHRKLLDVWALFALAIPFSKSTSFFCRLDLGCAAGFPVANTVSPSFPHRIDLATSLALISIFVSPLFPQNISFRAQSAVVVGVSIVHAAFQLFLLLFLEKQRYFC